MNVHVTQQILHHLDEHLTTLVAVLTGSNSREASCEHVGLRFDSPRETEFSFPLAAPFVLPALLRTPLLFLTYCK